MRPARVHKYGAKPLECSAGHKHPSRKEARRCEDLRLLERAGEISSLQYAPQFWFEIGGVPLLHDNGRRCGYQGDFAYRTPAGQQVVEDTKGVVVRDWPLRRALFRHLFPNVELREL